MAFLWLVSCFTLLGFSSGQEVPGCMLVESGVALEGHKEPGSLPELNIIPRIINGQEARPGAWPWHVALVNQHGYPRCGGVLINRNWVVTVAHCNFTIANKVVAGLHDLRLPSNIQKLGIAQVFRHPMFNHTSPHSDIALLKLRTGAHYNSKVFPLHLPRVDDQFLPRSLCKIMGWGFTDINGTKKPNKLQEASVAIMDNSICNRFYPHLSPNVMFCVWHRGVSSHRGDSGGSVACPKNGVWTLAGIMSCTRNSSLTKIPFVATRITAFLPWIEEILAKN